MPWENEPKNPVYGSAEYRKARKLCLETAGFRCQIRLDGICIGRATEADHELGLRADPHHQHLRAACSPCHKKVTQRQAHGHHADPDPTPRTAW